MAAPAACKAALGGFDIESRDVVNERVFQFYDEPLAELAADGPLERCDIWVRPFSVVIDDVEYGLIYQQDEWEKDYVQDERETPEEWVMLEPINLMFHPPWDSGEYSS